jgi:hypothetical protein
MKKGPNTFSGLFPFSLAAAPGNFLAGISSHCIPLRPMHPMHPISRVCGETHEAKRARSLTERKLRCQKSDPSPPET